jgi:hypothetical protein
VIELTFISYEEILEHSNIPQDVQNQNSVLQKNNKQQQG